MRKLRGVYCPGPLYLCRIFGRRNHSPSPNTLEAILFEFFEKHIVHPLCDLVEKATGLAVFQSTSFGLLIKIEEEWAMVIA